MLKVRLDEEKLQKSKYFNSGCLIIDNKQLLNDIYGVFISWESFGSAEGLILKKEGDWITLTPSKFNIKVEDNGLEVLKSVEPLDIQKSISEAFELFFTFNYEAIKECNFNDLINLFRTAIENENEWYIDIDGNTNNNKNLLYITICSHIRLVLTLSSYYSKIFFEGYFIECEADKKLSQELFKKSIMINSAEDLDLSDSLEYIDEKDFLKIFQ